jgi:hypothetical protein
VRAVASPHPSSRVIRSATRPAVGGRRGQLTHEAAVGKKQDPVGIRGSHRVVRHYHHGLAQPVHDLPEQTEDLSAGAGVQRPGRLVGEDHRRAGHQRSCDRHPLLLAARKLRRPVPRTIGEPDLVEHLPQPGGVRAGAGQPQRQGDVLRRGQRRQEVEGRTRPAHAAVR